MPKKMDPPPKRHHPSLADRVTGRAKVVTFFKSGDRNFKGVQIPIRKKYNFSTLLSDLDRVSNFPFGVRRIVTPSATHDVTELEDFEDGKMYIMAPTKKKPKPLDLAGIQARPPWAPSKALPGSGASGTEAELISPRKIPGNHANGNLRSSESMHRTVKKLMVMRNGDPHSKHMMLLNRNKIPSFEAFLTDVGESFQLPAQKLFTSDGVRVESLSAIFNGSEDLFVVGTGVEKFRPGSYTENSPFKPSSRQRESLRRKSTDESDQPPQKIIKKSRGKFRMWVATSENPSAGTDATVSITVYGDKGKSDDIVLGCGNGKFESGNEDEFNINVGSIGDIYKIRIGHDDSTEFAGWLCEEVRLQDVHTGDEMVFPCGRWMSRQEDDGQTCRELPVMVDGSPVFPTVSYHVAVVTGNYWNAGTTAKVYITMYGERGDTGPRLLHKTKRAKKFEKGKTDIFNIEAVSLGMLKKILIGHNSTDPEDGWYLEKVVLKDHKGSSLESVFPCHCWLDATLDEDGKTSREIYISNKPTNLEKEMWEQEKWKFKPSNQMVFISKGSGKAVQIKADGSVEATADPYSLPKTAIFEAQKVKPNVHIISSVANPEHCITMDSNKISNKGKGNELKLRVQMDRSIVIETAKNSSQLLTFGQTGKPGDVRGPALGPNRQFFCYVKGMFRDEGITMFYTSRIQTLTVTPDRSCRATGQRSEEAYWRIHKVGDSGSVRMLESLSQPGSFLRIKDGHCDVQGSGDNCCHFKVLRVKDKGYVSLQSVESADVCIGFVPDGNVKPTVDTGEDNVRLYPHVIQFGTKKSVVTPTPPTSAKPAVNRKKRVLNKQSNGNAKKTAALPLTPTPTPSPPVREKSVYDDGDWKVWVKTGKAGTKASVVLVVYGEEGVSKPFTLGKGGKELFKAGEENEFKVNVLSVGDIYKIRIGLDTTSKKAAWRLDQVKMKDMITEEQLLFKFKNRWLSPNEDDADVWRESAAVRPGGKPLPINKYSVQARTGSDVGSSTDANVYLCLYGEKGDTGKRQLIKSNHAEKFQESQTDMFELEAVTVLTPTKVVVGHDGKGPGAGWFLDEVVIKEAKTSKTEYVFPCNRWLDEGQDDKLIERELELGEVREIQPHEWQVYVTTGSDNSAGTTAMVTLVAYGDKDKTEVALIPKGDNGFRPGTTHDFRVYLGDIGQLYKIRIGHDNAAKDASWYLKTVRMLDLNELTEMEFAFDRWLSEKHDDLDVWRELPAVVAGKKPLPVTRYYVQVYTSSEENAGTEASVYLQLAGKNGDSGKRRLVRSKNNKDRKFLAGQMDVFEIEAVYLGRLQRVTVGHDGKEAGQGWFLEKVVVKESKNAKNETLFPCKKWLDAGQDDQKIERDLTPAKPTSAPNPVTSESAASKTDSITISWKPPTSGKVTGYRVTCDPPDAPASEVIITDAKTTKAEFGGLIPGRAYQFDIVTINTDLESDKVSLKTNAKPNAVLDAVLESTVDAVIVSWTHPQGELSGYKARISPSDAKKSVVKIKDPSKTRTEFVGLAPAKQYKVDVVTVSGEVESEKVTLQETTKMPEIHVLKVPSAEATKATSESLAVSWTKPEGDVTGYRLAILPAEGATPDLKLDGADKTTAEFKGLSPGQEYTVEVYTVYKEQESEKMTLTARTDAQSNQPKDPTASSTPTTISVSWTKPEGTVTGYRLLCTPADSETSEIMIDNGDTTTVQVDGLTPGRQYELEIYARNGDVESNKTTLSQRTKPSEVLDARIESSSTDTVNLAWTRPEGDLTGYRIEYQPVSKEETDRQDKPADGHDELVDHRDKPVDDQDKPVDDRDKPVDDQDKPASGQTADSQTVSVDGADTTNCEVTGLTPGQRYLFNIVTVSEQEESEKVSVNCTTKPLPVLEPKTNSTTESVTVGWSAPDCQLTGYRVVCRLKNSDSQEARGGGEGQSNVMPEKTDQPKAEDPADSPANEKPERSNEPKETEDPASSDPGNEGSPADETAPSSGEKSPANASLSTEGSKQVVEEKKVEADVNEVEFTGLTQMTEYSFDIYTVCSDVESEAVTVDEKTKKVKLPTQGDWKLWISTDEDSKPPHNARAHIVVYGEKGMSPPIMLTEEEEHAYFQAGNTDEFKISVGDIGDIYKIRIGHDDDTEWQGWHLKQVKMVDQHSEEELVFEFDRWMSRQEDDFDVVRELPAVREGQETLSVNVYRVCVSTGDHWAAFTDAKMWVVLHGERGDTGKRVLYQSLNNPVKYMKGQMDEFKVEAVSLGEVSMVEIGHDSVGYGAGIFIDSVTVRESEAADKEYLFACHSWLDDHMEDRQTSRQLQLLGVRPIVSDSNDEPTQDSADTSWKVIVQTSDLENAGTTSNVYLTVFGDSGRSPSHTLQGKTLDTNTEQEFDVDLGDIGEVTKIRLEHDNSGDSPAWHVQQVRLVHAAKPELVFQVNTWLSSDQGDNPSTVKEVAAIRAGVDPLPVVNYTVQVQIREDPDSASTNPDLSIALAGEAGEMAKRELIRTGEPVCEDGKVKVDTFSFDAVSVGQLERAILSISSKEKQDTWFVEKVTVREGKYATTRSVFPCKMWFGNAIIGEDGSTVLQTDLKPEGEEVVPKDKEVSEEDDGESSSKGRWTVWITPGQDDGMGTDANLSIQVYGEKGRSEVIPFRAEGDDKAKEDNEGQGADERKATPSKENEAETDESADKAEENGDGVQDLAFSPGSTKEFDIDVGEIGPIYKIRLSLDSCDMKDDTPSIFLDKVKMKDKDTNQEFHFFINRWLCCPDDTKLLPTEASPVEAPEPGAKQEDKSGKKSNEEKPGDEKKTTSKAGKTKDSKEEKVEDKKREEKEDEEDDETKDEATEQTQKTPAGDEAVDCYLELPAIRPDIPPLPVLTYELSVRTGDKGAASLSDVIYATVYGARGDTGCRILRKSNNPVMFKQAQVDIFAIEAVDILRPSSITIGHHSEGLGAGWYLDTVTLKQSALATTQYVFPCKRWMDTGVDDRKLERTLPLLGEVACPPSTTPDTKGLWQVRVKTSDQPDAGSTARVCVVVYGEKGQRSTHQLEREAFQPGSEEAFEINVGDIGAISKIRLQHDNSGDSPAWHVNSVGMKDVDSNEELDFRFDRWLARDQGDGQLCHEVPATREDKDPLQVYDYQVKVHTGDLDNAATEGAIHMTLQGSIGDSGERLLTTSNNSQKFGKGQVDMFTVQAVDLGKVHTITVRNESTEPSQAWYLDRVVVKTSPKAEREYVFPSSRWIGQADPESDELKAAENDAELPVQEKWKCTVQTSDLPECGTDASVSLVAYGDRGVSKVMSLTNGQEGNFKPGKSAVFELEPGPCIGDIYKIRVELDDGKDKSWHLKQIDLQDCFSDESLTFEYNGWLSRIQNEGKGDVIAEIPALRPGEEPLPSVMYYLQVFTGEAEDAGTDSEVSVTLFGERGDSGRRLLNKPRDGEKAFNEPQKTDIFDLEAVSLGSINKVLIHKASGRAWHLDRLIIKEGEFAATETEFKHEGWLGSKENPDQAVDTELVPTTERPSNTVAPLPEGQEPVQSKGNWKVFVTTGEAETAGTEANVTVTVCGSEGTSQPMPLAQDGQPTKMEPGQTQEFEVNVGEVGHIYKVRLEHDGTTQESDWFLEKIKMKDVDTKADFSYTVSRWLSRHQDGCNRVIEIPAIWPEKPIPQVVKYEVQVLTGDLDGADTQADVYLTLRGEHGETGRRDLVRDPGDPTAFSKGHTDKFTVEAVSLGRIDKCVVGRDGDQPESGWFLDKIIVSKSGEESGGVTFPCNRWLAADKSDNATEVELDPLPLSEGPGDGAGDGSADAQADAGQEGEEAKADRAQDDEAEDGEAQEKDEDGKAPVGQDEKKDDQ